MRFLLVGLGFLLVAACSASSLERTAIKPQERQLVQAAVEDISRGDAAALSKRLVPGLAGKLPVDAMRRQLPAPPLELSFERANWNMVGQGRVVDAVYDVRGKNGFALLEVAMTSNGSGPLITGLYIMRTPTDPKKLNGFDIKTAGVAGWAMIAAMAAAVAVTIIALIRIWRSGRFNRRWLWTIGAIIGVTTLRLNWSTGAFAFQPVSFELFSASALKQPSYGPWVLGVSVPLIALIALFWRGDHEGTDVGETSVPGNSEESG